MRVACGRIDPAHDQPFRQAQRLGGLTLSSRHGLDAGAEDLRQVGAVVEGQRRDAGPQRRQHDADLRQREVDDVDLDQQRRTADERHVQRRHGVDDRIGGQATQRAHHRQSRGEDDGRHADHDGGPRPADDEGRPLGHEAQVDLALREEQQGDADQDDGPGQREDDPRPPPAGPLRFLDLEHDGWHAGSRLAHARSPIPRRKGNGGTVCTAPPPMG